MTMNNENADIAREFFEKGFLLQKSGHIDRAAHFYKRSLEFHPTAQAHTFLGWIYSIKGMYDEAIEECKSAIRLDPEYGNPYNDIGAYLIQQYKYDEAKPWLLKALDAENYTNYSFPYMNLGKIYEFKGEWETALDCYKKAMEEDPEYEPAELAYNKLLAKYN